MYAPNIPQTEDIPRTFGQWEKMVKQSGILDRKG
jgi:hypothetical protein